jgi:hypothetical protein
MRITKNFVPIDVNVIGEKLGVDGDIIFSSLYYHLNQKYSYPIAKVSRDTNVAQRGASGSIGISTGEK